MPIFDSLAVIADSYFEGLQLLEAIVFHSQLSENSRNRLIENIPSISGLGLQAPSFCLPTLFLSSLKLPSLLGIPDELRFMKKVQGGFDIR